MKPESQPVQPVEAFRPANRQALVELESFLRAVDSYPERFAREPEISFEQHLNSLHIHGAQLPSGQDRRQSSKP